MEEEGAQAYRTVGAVHGKALVEEAGAEGTNALRPSMVAVMEAARLSEGPL